MTTFSSNENPSVEFSDELKPGTKLLHGQYVISQFLNNGGFGITYLAKDSLHRLVVIKECYPEAICRRDGDVVCARSRNHAEAYDKMVELFVGEARNLARLSHPNIVGVHQVFEDNGTAYMALDYVDGQDLLEMAEQREGVQPEILEAMVVKLLDAIEFIHSEGILHRDIAPDNILLRDNREPILIDFGAARETVTRATRYLGAIQAVKDGYSPQEFYVADADQYPCSDLYSLAASLYHVITKEIPPNAQERLSAIAGGDPDPCAPLSGRFKGYSDVFLDSIDRAMDVFPKNRLQTATEWRGLLTQVADLPVRRGMVSRPMLAVDNAREVLSKTKARKINPIKTLTREVTKLTRELTREVTRDVAKDDAPQVDPTLPLTEGERLERRVTMELKPVLAGKTKSSKAPMVAAAALLVAGVGAGAFFLTGSDTPDTVVTSPSTGKVTFESAGPAPGSDAVVPSAPAQSGTLEVREEAADPASTPEPEKQTVATAEPGISDLPIDPVISGATVAELAANAAPTLDAAPSATPAPEARPEILADAATSPPVSDEAPYDAVDLIVDNSDAGTSVRAGTLPNVTTTPEAGAVAPQLAELGAAPELDGAPRLNTDAPASLNEPGATGPVEISAVITGSAIEFPVEADSTSPSVIVSADGQAGETLKPGFEILSTNGFPITAINDVPRVVNATSSYSVGDVVNVTFGLKDPITNATSVETVGLQTVQETLLLNGVRFQTKRDDGTWVTTVADGTNTGSNGLVAGDEVVAFIPTDELIDGPGTLARIMRREVEAGTSNFAFAVKRDEQMWFVSMQYRAGGRN